MVVGWGHSISVLRENDLRSHKVLIFRRKSAEYALNSSMPWTEQSNKSTESIILVLIFHFYARTMKSLGKLFIFWNLA